MIYGPCRTTSKERRQAKMRNYLSEVKLKLHGLWWGFLWGAHIATPYSRFMCRKGWYEKFSDGRCMYCGKQDEARRE
jgi:hypothetical protein